MTNPAITPADVTTPPITPVDVNKIIGDLSAAVSDATDRAVELARAAGDKAIQQLKEAEMNAPKAAE
jgi:hypothetical protein